MPSFHDAELGEIIVKRNSRSNSIRMHVGTNGKLIVSAPALAPLFLIKQTVKASRAKLAQLLRSSDVKTYNAGDTIGQSHKLVVKSGANLAVTIDRRNLVVTLPTNYQLLDPTVQYKIREKVITLLRKEAKIYLTARLRTLADRHGFHYSAVRFTHAATRWGSCSSRGTISLNIALMSLSLEQIDYVLVHELCHTREMNHSSRFWAQVAEVEPHYKLYRRQLKTKTPHI